MRILTEDEFKKILLNRLGNGKNLKIRSYHYTKVLRFERVRLRTSELEYDVFNPGVI